MKQEILDALKLWGPLQVIWVTFLYHHLPLYEFSVISSIIIALIFIVTLATELKIYDIKSDFDIKTGEWTKIRRVE